MEWGLKKKIEKKKANIVFICVLDKNKVMQAKQHTFVQHVSGIFQVGQPFQKVIGDWLSDSVMGEKKPLTQLWRYMKRFSLILRLIPMEYFTQLNTLQF